MRLAVLHLENTTTACRRSPLLHVEFNGRTVPWRAAKAMDHGCAITATDLAELVGYRSKDEVTRIIQRNKRRFPATEATTVKLTAVDGKAREQCILSPRGCIRFCIYGRTPKCFAFHDAIVDLLDRLGSGEAAVVTRDQVQALIGEAVRSALAVQADAHRQERERDQRKIESIAHAVAAGVSRAAAEVAEYGRNDEVRALALEFRRRHEPQRALWQMYDEPALQELERKVEKAVRATPPSTVPTIAGLARQLHVPRRYVGDAVTRLLASGRLRRRGRRHAGRLEPGDAGRPPIVAGGNGSSTPANRLPKE